MVLVTHGCRVTASIVVAGKKRCMGNSICGIAFGAWLSFIGYNRQAKGNFWSPGRLGKWLSRKIQRGCRTNHHREGCRRHHLSLVPIPTHASPIDSEVRCLQQEDRMEHGGLGRQRCQQDIYRQYFWTCLVERWYGCGSHCAQESGQNRSIVLEAYTNRSCPTEYG